LKDTLSPEEMLHQVRGFGADLVGITCLSAFYFEAVRLSRLLKAAGYRVVLGGVHPSILPHRTLVDSSCDFVICGEGEKALVALCDRELAHEGIQGCYARSDLNGEEKRVQYAEVFEDLDHLPFPDWDKMTPASFPKAPHGAIVKNFPIGVIMSTRGCPYSCTFCASPEFYNRRIRYRSPGNVADEIEMLVQRYGVREIHFEDDNLTLKRSHVESICRLLIERGIRLSWACPNGVRADKVDDELIRLMKESGCYYIAFGIESANDAILENVKKGETIETIHRAISIAARHDIVCQGFFIFGLPGETEASIRNTIDFALRSMLNRAQFLILDVLPGSELWTRLKGEFVPRFDKNSYKEPEWIPEGLTREMLMSYQSLAFRRFHLRPAVLWGLLRWMKWSQLRFILGRILDYRIQNVFK
jgi:radical SAM superfamily enzyme YgiQ (UPF0313 family)